MSARRSGAGRRFCERRRKPCNAAAFALLLTWFFGASVHAASALENHSSPYLALHADDPVDWREWDRRALDAARVEDRLLFLSIGYFSCHWCHVMQRESFRDEAIAAVMNDRFVPVKIDRELESALDARMVEFAETTLGQAGWPLNVFVTPEGHPLLAVLYMPPSQFRQVLDRVTELWDDQRDRMRELARRVGEGELPDAAPLVDVSRVESLRETFLVQAEALHDDFEGGFGNQNKFPQAPALDYLLDLAAAGGGALAHRILETTLDGMARGGLYDHVGGGFFRYAVDPGWYTPHFEKMLYDNALLASVYLRADGVIPGRGYADVARATLDFMRREMLSPDGAMIASLSAVDGDGVEGGYYLFDDETLSGSLDDDELRVVRAACDVSGVPVLAAGHHLRCSRSLTHVSRNMGIDEGQAIAILRGALDKLRMLRRERVLPADTKLLAGWNGLALGAFSEAARLLDEPSYEHTARGIRDYIMTRLWDGERLLRARTDAGALGSASIEDYAFVARGLWQFAALVDSDEDRESARALVAAGFATFRRANGWRLGERELLAPAPPRELITDSPMPSPAALLGDLALDAGIRFDDEDLLAMAHDALNRGYDTLSGNAFFHATHIRALGRLASGVSNRPRAADE